MRATQTNIAASGEGDYMTIIPAWSWTDERVQTLRRLHAAHATTPEIVKATGAPTRNAVLGKIHRLGMAETRAPRPKPPPQPKAPKPNLERVVRIFDRGGAGLERREVYLMPPIKEPPPPKKAIGRCSLLDLRGDSCRWPIGDVGKPDFVFCGDTKIDGTPYCDYHCRIAYQPAAARRRSPGVPWRPMRSG